MEILDTDNALRAKLQGQTGKDIHIISAFASSTDSMIAELREHNRVELIVGTMNYFTEPEFIQAVRDQPRGREGFWVDFRGSASIHWKLYLISPRTVIVGSANLTNKGVAMLGETSVLIRSKVLYEDYLSRIRVLQAEKHVVPAKSGAFDRRLADYTDLHERHQASRQAQGADKPTGQVLAPSLAQWLENDANQSISVFLWENKVEDLLKEKAKRIVDRIRLAAGKGLSTSGRNPYRELFTSHMAAGEKSPFRSGDVALCASIRGGYIGFHKFHIVERVGNKDLMIELRHEPDAFPFEITPALKAAIKTHIVANDYESSPRVFRRKLLTELAVQV